MKFSIIFLLLSSLIFFACKGTSDNPDEPDTGENYPTATGNIWQYQKITSTTFYPPDRAAYTETDTSISRVIISGTQVFPGEVMTHVFDCTESSGKYAQNSTEYYQVMPDGFYSYAYANAGTLIQPKRLVANKVLFNGQSFESISDLVYKIQYPRVIQKQNPDSIIIEEHPVLAIKYPLRINSSWTYRPINSPFGINKSVEATETIVRGGRHHICYLVRWEYDIDNNAVPDDDIYIIDYISAEGLIERIISVSEIIMYDGILEPTGSADLLYTYSITDINLK